jgi:predicted Zn-dependent peptidase
MPLHSGEAFVANWEITTLANGLRIVTAPMPSTQAVSVNIFVGVGSRSEPARLNGITHFLEHMVFKGTEKRPDAILIAQEIEGAGGTLNAYTNKEFTCYWNIVPFDRFETALDVAADMLLHSKLEQEEIERECPVVQQELKRNHDNPGAWAGRLIGTSVYGEQPAGWDVGGPVELIPTWSRPDFIGHISEWYKPSNIVLSVAGNVTHEQVVALATPLFSEMVDGPLPAIIPYDSTISGARVATDTRPIDQCTMYLGLPMFGRDDPDRFAMRIMNDVLGAGMSSRLFREVRERRGLAYSVGSGYGYLSDAGVFTISAGVNRDKLRETISVCLEETEKLVTELVPAEELRKAKDHNIGRFRLSLETAFSIGQRNGELLLTKGAIESVDDVVAQIEAITADHVQAVAKRVILREKLHCSVVGPELEEAEIESAMA